MSLEDFRSLVDARCVLMLDVTCQTLRDDAELRLCEGLRLIEATHKAMARLAPEAMHLFESDVLPHLRQILMERFGVSQLPGDPVN
jgi:hypothetical protein